MPALLFALLASSAIAQGTKADYERAANLRKLTENKVLNRRVEPHWLPDNTRFWYRRETPGDGWEFILIDAEKGSREPAFDHARLAEALRKAGVNPANASRLPIDGLEFPTDRLSFNFRCNGKSWRCDLPTYELSEPPKATTPGSAQPLTETPPASQRTGAETSLTFVNRTPAEVALFWLDTEGARQSYGKIGAGQEHAQHTYAGHVWVVLNDRGDTLATFEAEDQAATAEIDGRRTGDAPTKPVVRERRRGTSPDGKWRAFIRDHNVWLASTNAAEEFALSTGGSADDAFGDSLHWSPDSTKLVAMQTRKGEERKVYLIESSPKDQLQPKLHSYDYRKPGDQIPLPRPRLFDVTKRHQVPVSDELFPSPWAVGEIRWDRGSRWFQFLYNQRGHQILRIIAVDATSGTTRVMVDEQSSTFIDYSGKKFSHATEDSREIIWASERGGWNHLYLYDTETGRVKNPITHGEWVVRGVDRVDEKTRQIWFRAGGIRAGQDPYYVHHCRVNFDGSGLVVLTEGDGTHGIAHSPDKRFLIDTYSRVDLAPVTELRRAADGQRIAEIERADSSELRKTGWRAPEPFVAKGRDGVTDIFGVIIRPTHFDPDRKYPVIESIYAGPQGAFVPKEFRPAGSMPELAELGFIVVQIDGMGTSHRSKAFHDVCWKNLGDAGFPDRMLWMKAAAAKDPSLDLTRVGIYGGSAGGQNSTRALLAHGDFYQVAVSDCGCHDNRMDKIWWNEQWMGWPIGPHYEEQSNVTQAHRLQGKLLLIVGELDRNVDPASTMQVVNALIKADKDFDMLVVPGGGHGIAESPYGKRRRADYFVRHLLGVEPRGSGEKK